jgi:hypothetical protein
LGIGIGWDKALLGALERLVFALGSSHLERLVFEIGKAGKRVSEA